MKQKKLLPHTSPGLLQLETARRPVAFLSGRETSSSAAHALMEVIVGDRKVWTAMETRALITLKEEMKLKFQTMKRNRTLWIELSDKMRRHYGHERSPVQCAVRWKNIISAYKDSRDALRNPRPDGKVCLFFKEVEAILGDPPLKLPVAEHGRTRTPLSSAPPLQNPRKHERSREPKGANIATLLLELISKVDAQGAAIARIEKMLEQGDMDGATPVPEALQSSERIPVPLSENMVGNSSGAGRLYSVGDSDVLLERPSTTSVPDLNVSSEGAPHLNCDTGPLDSARPSLVNSAHNLPCTEQVPRQDGVAHPESVVETTEEAVTGEEVAVPVAEILDGSVRHRPTSPSSVPIVAGMDENDRAIGADGKLDRADVATRSVSMGSVQQVITAIPKAIEAQGSDGSVGGNVDIDLINSGLGKESNSEVSAAKKRKLAHACI